MHRRRLAPEQVQALEHGGLKAISPLPAARAYLARRRERRETRRLLLLLAVLAALDLGTLWWIWCG
ncbi:MAG: hypothetical protein Kow0092_11590 [Deferrisomatales bacterium]